MAFSQPTMYLAEVGTPHSHSPAYQTCPIIAATVEEASRKACRWAVLVIATCRDPHHLRLVKGDEVVWARTFGETVRG